MRRLQFAASLTPIVALLLVPAVMSQPVTPALRGFSSANAAVQRDLEAKFRGIPKPDNLREYMLATASEPHHAGSPGSRKVAEYVLGKFKSFGLDARIEEFEA